MQTTTTPRTMTQITNTLYAVCDSLKELEDQFGYQLGIDIVTLYRVAAELERHDQHEGAA